LKCPRCQQESPDGTLYCSHCGYRLIKLEQNGPSFTETLHFPILELPIGTLFAKRYLVVADLGKGGMGRVYKVLDKEINEVIALKVLKPEIASDEQIIERFRNELKLARRISQKNVCGMYHLSKDENNIHYITMEFVPGEDLKSLIRRIGQLTVGKAVFIGMQICEGLAEAHRLGVVHRDLKPRNIMIDQEGHVRIMDFGIARSPQREGLTRPDMIIGTPEYMAPEQLENTEIDNRTDIYSLGVVLFEMLTGQLPFKGDTPLSIAWKHKSELPPAPQKFNSQIPNSLNQIILKCLEKKRENRYPSAADLYKDLKLVEQGLPQTGMTRRADEARSSEAMIRKRRWTGVGVSLLAILLLSAGYLLWKYFRPAEARYENYISFQWLTLNPADSQNEMIKYLMLRSLAGSTRLNIFGHEDVLVYKKRTEFVDLETLPPFLSITGEVHPKVTGFEIALSVKLRNKTHKKRFDCKGTFDFLDHKLGTILSFIAANSEGTVGQIEGNLAPAQIASPSLDALAHFLKGEKAWDLLDVDAAFYEYRTALENDPEFSLASLRLAEVLAFRSDREGAQLNLRQALSRKNRLIANDVLRLNALLARIDSRPSEERQAIGKLVEEFPFKKEYHYELGESYFHYGDADEAIKHYTRALELDPNYSLAHNHIAFCLSWTGDHNQAEEHFKRYVELDHTGNSYDSLASGLMFAGRYDDAIEALQKGMELSPSLDYLYGNLSRNWILKGALSRAAEAVERQAALAKLANTKMSAQFLSAYIEYLRGNPQRCRQKLAPVTEFFSRDAFSRRLDEAPSLPFWLLGVMAAEKGDRLGLRDQVVVMEKKIMENNVSSTNYFPIYKFYVHLKALEGVLENDEKKVLASIEEGRRMRNKMGYWTSLFDLAFFFDQYAKIFIRQQQYDKALSMLEEALSYNPNSPCCHLSLAEIYLQKQQKGETQEELRRVSELLSQADKNSHLARQLEKIRARLKISAGAS
jgi:serine/threonine protein kinase/predicted Zn-dependent protease